MSHRLRRGLVFVVFCLGAATALPLPGRADDAPKGRQYALLVGVRNYNKDELHSLPYTENDVTELGQVLREAGYKRVVVMTQTEAAKEGDNELLPEGRHIRDQIDALLRDRQADDSVVIAFSGHGVQPRDKGSYFCPMDAQVKDLTTLVSLADVYKALEESKAGMKVLLVDACRNDPLVQGDKAVDKLNLESVTRPQAEKAPGGVAALFSCSEGQRSFESEEFKHGVFFHYVIEGLKGEAANKKGEVGLTDLARYVVNEVPDQAEKEWGTKARQLPQLKGDVSGSAPLAAVALKKELSNSLHMKLVLIHTGVYMMGSPKGEGGRYDIEGLPRQVEITQPFYLAACTVTKGQFAAFVKNDGYPTEAEKAGDKKTWRNPGYGQTDDDPVVWVTWNDAVQFCRWLSKKEDKTYELPAEAEWEYACRAGTTTAYSFGNDPKDLGEYAWYVGNSGGRSHAAAGKKPNPWSLYDMHGNVWQWCAEGSAPAARPVPKEGMNNDSIGPDDAKIRVIRGGSWYDVARDCRSASRNLVAPGYRIFDIGFRVVLRPGVRTP